MRPAELDVRNPQTKTKHSILQRYAGAWGGIILNGLKSTAVKQRPGFVHLVYVDAFASNGRYSQDTDSLTSRSQPEPVWGSPIIGIRELDGLQQMAEERLGFHINVSAVLCEREPERYQSLRESLGLAGLGPRVQDSMLGLADRQIAAINGDFHEIAEAVLDHTAGDKFSLVLLDPYGPAAIPHQLVRRFVAGERNRRDIVITFPFQDVLKKTGYAARADETARKILSHHTAMFGDNGEWIKIARPPAGDRLGARPRGDAEAALVEHYRARLQAMDAAVTVKHIGLRFPDRQRTMFYLFLTTHDPTGALKMNEVLSKARLTEQVIRERHRVSSRLRKHEERGQSALFGPEDLAPAPAEPPRPEVDTDTLAADMLREFQGQHVLYRQVRRSYAGSDCWSTHLDAAMRKLRKAGAVQFERLRNDETVRFASQGQPR